jgi:hypothetical protein
VLLWLFFGKPAEFLAEGAFLEGNVGVAQSRAFWAIPLGYRQISTAGCFGLRSQEIAQERHRVNFDGVSVINRVLRKALAPGVNLGGVSHVGNALGAIGVFGFGEEHPGLIKP